ncbi:SDR family NAD(P)-dependent oxidoreductase [Pseudoruegeria sp. SHC-113]|uniref:SDR family NAD(P)-dependent oxidoreductase n=1 Tax=Pseudoruegeria sp. SHC-113 TaxID=2855439 RepID=UPI0021BB0712|nr:SDR family oxidoreductase [Pseudoruegeria sp. SHC-113]MCT8158677.1 SDR family oxidoreductase [Pseudoruegeria sp. SHC-113]
MTAETPRAQVSKGRFAGRRALVTGGSRGIAAAICRALAAEGASVAVNFSAQADSKIGKASAAEALVADLRAGGATAVAVEQDLMQPGGGASLAAKAHAALGGIDTLVLSASIQYHLPFLRQSIAEVEEQLRINILSNIEMLQACLPDMARDGYGRVLTVGSIQEVSPAAEMPIYSLTKAAMKNLVENLAVQAAGQGVLINNIAPGLVETDRNAFRRSDPAAWAALQAGANPVGRAGQPEDLTELALFLLSPGNGFTTGATIYATGGSHIPNAGGQNRPELVLPESEGLTAPPQAAER